MSKSVRIGPHKFALVYVDKVDEEDNWGHYSQADQNIMLSNALLPEGSKWAEILLHEIFHGVADEREIFDDDKTEERAVKLFAMGFAQVLKDNKTLFRAILKALA